LDECLRHQACVGFIQMETKEIQPSSVRLRGPELGTLTARIVLASSNGLRRHMGFEAGGILAGPVPRFVTRTNPSLDNYFADLLLRSCYEAVDYLPAYDEHVILGSPDELRSELNPLLAGAVLIGIGGRSNNPDFTKVYDEHAYGGTRTAPSASEIVFREHLEAHQTNPGVQSVRRLLNEINWIDSEGGATSGHLYNTLKSLNVAEFIRPGFVFEPLHAQEKRALIGACLASVCVAMGEFENYDLEASIKDLETEWETYLAKIEKRIKYGFPDKIIPAAAKDIRNALLKAREPQIKGVTSYLTLKRILFAFRHCWHPSIVAYLLEFLFDALRQVQQSFEEINKADVPIRELAGGHAFVYYLQTPKDRLPHRGLLARMSSKSIKGLVVVFNPTSETTAIFGTRHLSRTIWRGFVEKLLQYEGESVWYVPTAADGTFANFVLNGTESFRGVSKSALSPDNLCELLAEAIEKEAIVHSQAN
jgi:hypothetical protein